MGLAGRTHTRPWKPPNGDSKPEAPRPEAQGRGRAPPALNSQASGSREPRARRYHSLRPCTPLECPTDRCCTGHRLLAGRAQVKVCGSGEGGPHSAELLPGAAHLCSDSSSSPALRSLSQVLTFQWPVQEASCLRSQQQGTRPWGRESCFCSSRAGLRGPSLPQGASCPTFEELGAVLADRAERLLHRHLLL